MLTLTFRPPILTCLQNETPPIYAGPRPFPLRQPVEWGSSVRSAVDAQQCSNTSVVMVIAITKTRFQVISPDIGHDDQQVVLLIPSDIPVEVSETRWPSSDPAPTPPYLPMSDQHRHARSVVPAQGRHECVDRVLPANGHREISAPGRRAALRWPGCGELLPRRSTASGGFVCRLP
jgi:hypothetical protein